jgi:uncharacterized protein (UPF0335 family)
MPKTSKTDDPATAMNAASQALAKDRALNVYLDRIISAEKIRNAASEDIRKIWNQVKRDGFDVQEARTALVRRVCTR